MKCKRFCLGVSITNCMQMRDHSHLFHYSATYYIKHCTSRFILCDNTWTILNRVNFIAVYMISLLCFYSYESEKVYDLAMKF